MRYTLSERLTAALVLVLGLLVGVGCAQTQSSATRTQERGGAAADATSERPIKSSPSVITAAEIEQRPGATIAEILKGRVAGVEVMGNRVLIRGKSSIMGSNEPLYVVDGVPLMFAPSMNPLDIETIEVLKGSETALYGVRGANGVIVITTKRAN